jgi:putative acetyltransferase
MPEIRSETPEDVASVRTVIERAFGRTDEADLVDALRSNVPSSISIVAVEDDRVVGHILFSPVRVAAEDSAFGATALAPLAVAPEYQNRGIGAALVRAGLDECRRRGERVVFVLGHPSYYPRFGFEPSKPRGVGCEFDVSDEAFMVAELEPDALEGRTGTVHYRPEFSAF